jgi:hypothetical protein
MSLEASTSCLNLQLLIFWALWGSANDVWVRKKAGRWVYIHHLGTRSWVDAVWMHPLNFQFPGCRVIGQQSPWFPLVPFVHLCSGCQCYPQEAGTTHLLWSHVWFCILWTSKGPHGHEGVLQDGLKSEACWNFLNCESFYSCLTLFSLHILSCSDENVCSELLWFRATSWKYLWWTKRWTEQQGSCNAVWLFMIQARTPKRIKRGAL